MEKPRFLAPMTDNACPGSSPGRAANILTMIKEIPMTLHQYVESFCFLIKIVSMSFDGFITNMSIFAQVIEQSFL